MGSCGSKLQKETVRINIVQTKSKKCIQTLKQSETHPTDCNDAKFNDGDDGLLTHPPGIVSEDSLFSSSFGIERIDNENDNNDTNTNTNTTNTTSTTTSTTNNSTGMYNEPLINLRFKRTLFCEDITYEYEMSCNLMDNINNEQMIAIPQWILRLTVEKMTKFYAETLEKWAGNEIKSIPFQFGKVMKAKVFTSLLHNILQQASILKDKNTFFSETTANFLNIPYDIRSIIQYNPERFIHCEQDIHTFKYWDIIYENNEKYRYLCHNTMIYKHDYEYDDCCQLLQCYDEESITSYSYWVRSLQNKIDFLINITSNNIFYMIMSDLAYNIANILINHIGFDDNSAWIITDYLPKYLLFNHIDDTCNAQIIYKYEGKRSYYEDEVEDDEDGESDIDEEAENGQFLLEVMGNKLLQRHNINVNELHNFCEKLRVQHTSLPPSLPEMSPSLSDDEQEEAEYLEESVTITNTNTKSINSESYKSLLEINSEKYRIFFTAFIDEQGEDDINIYQWMQSLQKIAINLTEKQIVSAFNFMIQQNEDCDGYIDYIDFTHFCQLNCQNIMDKDVKRTLQLLNNFILRN